MAELELTVSQASFSPFSSMPDSCVDSHLAGHMWYHDWKAQAKESEAGVRLSEEMGPRLLTFLHLENTTLSMYDILKSVIYFSGQMWFGQGLHLESH